MNRTSLVLTATILILIAIGSFYLLTLRQRTEPVVTPSPTPVVIASPAPSPTTHPLIRVESPQPEERITSPLTLSGQARGQWFFEATFPVVLTNWDGLIIAEGFATAEGEWMTEEFVPFTATLEFTSPPSGERGFLILQRSNPSGLPENDDAVEIPVFFE